MRHRYNPETDSLYLDLNNVPGVEARQVADGLVVDLDAHGRAVGFDIAHASTRLDLSKIETVALSLSDSAA